MSETSDNFLKCEECGMTFWIDISKGPQFGWDHVQKVHAEHAPDHRFKPEWVQKDPLREWRQG